VNKYMNSEVKAKMDKTLIVREVVELQGQVDAVVKQFDAEPWIELKMTIAQLKSIFFIASRGKTNFKKLADALGVTPPNITGIIDRLVEQGLVSRTENTEDRRIMLLQVTEKGQQLVNTLVENRFLQMNTLMMQLNDEELLGLRTGYKGMLKAAEAMKEKGQESGSN
jgi:MarR family transcriptional regulator, organic hydroperoxide resistance regulator